MAQQRQLPAGSQWPTILRDALRRGHRVNPVTSAPDRYSGAIGASELRAVLLAPPSDVDPRGLTIVGAVIRGRLDLSYARIQFPVRLLRCSIPGGIAADTAHLGILDLTGSQLGPCLDEPALDLDAARIDGNVIALGAFSARGQVRFCGTRIDGELQLRGARIENPGRDALVVDGARIALGILADEGFEATGAVRLAGALIDGRVSFDGARLDHPGGDALVLDRARIVGGVHVDNLKASGKVRGGAAHIEGQLSLKGATITNAGGDSLVLDRAQIAGGIHANGMVAVGKVQMAGTGIDGQLQLREAVIKVVTGGDAMVLVGAQITGDVWADENFDVTGHVRATSARIGGSFRLCKALLHEGDGKLASLIIDNARIEGKFDLTGARLSLVDVSNSLITALDLRPAELESFIAIDAGLGSLITGKAAPPPGTFSGAGFRARHLSGAVGTNWQSAKAWLESVPDSPGFDPDPWYAFADVYRQHGDPGGAARLRHAAAKKTARAGKDWRKRIGGAAYNFSAGHGYFPLRSAGLLAVALVCTFAVIWIGRPEYVPSDPARAIAAASATSETNSDDSTPVDPTTSLTGSTPCSALENGAATYPCMEFSVVFGLAVNNTIPLGSVAPDWRTTNAWLVAALAALRVFAWISAAILVAGFTGLLKKD